MTRSVRRLLVSALALVALAIPVQSASAWTPANDYVFDGEMTWVMGSVGLPSLTCDWHVDDITLRSTVLNAKNPGLVNAAQITGCTTTVPNCTVSTVANGLGWPLSGRNLSGGSGPVLIDLSYTVTYSGGSCGWSGVNFTIKGGLSGDYDDSNGCIDFPANPSRTVLAASAGTIALGTRFTMQGDLCNTGATDPSLQ